VAVTALVWFDCTPPTETRVSQPFALASATRYSSYLSAHSTLPLGRRVIHTFLTLFPPYAKPELQSSLFAHIFTSPPSDDVRFGRNWIGDGPN
jgi:hypothetical protein